MDNQVESQLSEEEREKGRSYCRTLYRTGDFVRLQKGSLYFEGRVDAQVKVRGHRVDMLEIERTVAGEAGVTSACVLCYKVRHTSHDSCVQYWLGMLR